MHALRVTKDTHRASVGLVTALSSAFCRFVLYALSRPVRLLAGVSPDAFRTAVAPAAMAQGTFRGTYSR